MSKRRRRNLRTERKISKPSDIKVFKIAVGVLIIVICICVFFIIGRNNKNKKELAQQKEQLDKQIEAIFLDEDSNTENNDEVQEENKEDKTVTMVAVGDILCGNQMLKDAYNINSKSYNFDSMFSGANDLVKNADISIGTFETNVTDNQYLGAGKCNSPYEYAESVKKSGIDVVSVAHNHSLDYGVDGLNESNTKLRQAGFQTIGTKTSDEDNGYLIKNVDGVKIGFLAYTYGVNDQKTKTDDELKCINLYSDEKAIEDIKKIKEAGAEFVCVYMHWGEVNSNSISQEQKDDVNSLIDNGANMILGTHPAVVEPMEIRQNKDGDNVLVAYSLGNYISDFSNYDSNIELLLNIEIKKVGETGKVKLDKVTYTPMYVLDNGTKAENRFELIDMKQVASDYANGNTKKINKVTYQKLVNGLERLEKVIRSLS